jgi:hypothetical protein
VSKIEAEPVIEVALCIASLLCEATYSEYTGLGEAESSVERISDTTTITMDLIAPGNDERHLVTAICFEDLTNTLAIVQFLSARESRTASGIWNAIYVQDIAETFIRQILEGEMREFDVKHGFTDSALETNPVYTLVQHHACWHRQPFTSEVTASLFPTKSLNSSLDG